MKSLAPVAVFTYCRPLHTQRTIESLLRNRLAQDTDVTIFSDAAKTPDKNTDVRKVRQYINTISGFKSISIVERERNLGLANSIIDGVSRLCDEFGRVIVLEDDLELSPWFLEYMNSALDMYKDKSEVMHVSGYMFPVCESADISETFFYRVPSCWGWATWKRAWTHFESDSNKLISMISDKNLEHEFDVRGSVGYLSMLKKQAENNIDSWAVRWYASVFLNKGCCLHPARSLVNNIGHDGTGVHCDSNDNYEINMLNDKPINIDINQDVAESAQGVQAIIDFYKSFRPSYFKRILVRFRNLFKKITNKLFH